MFDKTAEMDLYQRFEMEMARYPFPHPCIDLGIDTSLGRIGTSLDPFINYKNTSESVNSHYLAGPDV